jgi:hypothetical protein
LFALYNLLSIILLRAKYGFAAGAAIKSPRGEKKIQNGTIDIFDN